MSYRSLLFLTLLLLTSCQQKQNIPQPISESITTTNCTELTSPPLSSNLSSLFSNTTERNLDMRHLGGEIISYKLFNGTEGKWSGWYVPDYNDYDDKYFEEKSGNKTVRVIKRMWSYFAVMNHSYIICK